MVDIELITGNLGQVLDEGNIDEKSRGLISEAYEEASKGVSPKLDFYGLIEATARLIKVYRDSNPEEDIESDAQVLGQLYDYATEL